MLTKKIAALLIAVAVCALVGHPAPASQDKKPTDKEAQLLKELVGVYGLGLSEAWSAYGNLWSGVQKGPDHDELWSEIAHYLILRYLTETGQWTTSNAKLNETNEAELKRQLAALASKLDERGVSVIIKSQPQLAKYEESARAKLLLVANAAADFLKREKETLKGAAINCDDLNALVTKALDLTKKREELFKTLKSVKMFVVHADKDWQDSEVKLKEGETVFAMSYGFVWGGSTGRISPDGIDEYKDYRPLKDAHYGALIARLEGMEKGFIKLGGSGSFEADRTGLLLLRPNFTDYSNKNGLFVTVVGVEKRKKKEDD